MNYEKHDRGRLWTSWFKYLKHLMISCPSPAWFLELSGFYQVQSSLMASCRLPASPAQLLPHGRQNTWKALGTSRRAGALWGKGGSVTREWSSGGRCGSPVLKLKDRPQKGGAWCDRLWPHDLWPWTLPWSTNLAPSFLHHVFTKHLLCAWLVGDGNAERESSGWN